MRSLALALFLLTGCLAAERSELAPANVEATHVRPLVPRAFPFEYEGATGFRKAVCAAGVCTVAGEGNLPGENEWVALSPRPSRLGANATLTWASETPETAELLFRIAIARDCGESCGVDEPFAVEVQGPSPLVLSAFDFPIDDDAAVVVSVRHAAVLPDPAAPAQLRYSLPQRFAVEGELLALAPEPVGSSRSE